MLPERITFVSRGITVLALKLHVLTNTSREERQCRLVHCSCGILIFVQPMAD